ncbi:MAG TPA: HlyD family secretion protein [Kofleriaceae bacterium]|nr:HlyD family secretion protein [Kofleriaceae bacterium]
MLSPAADKPSSKRPFVIVGAIILAGVIALVVYKVRSRGKESTDDAQVEADVVLLSVRTSGLVVAVPARDDSDVKQGDLLAQIDDVEAAARLKQAEAELEQAKAQATHAEVDEQIVAASATGGRAAAQALVSQSSYDVRGAASAIESATVEVARAEADARSADVDLARYKALRTDNVVPQSKLDEVQLAAERAQAAVAVARAALATAQERRHALDAQVMEAQGRLTQAAPVETQLAAARADTAFQRARVDAAAAAVTLARAQLDATRVVAPIAGRLTNLSLHAGVLAAVGTPVGLLVPPAPYVVANYKETQVGGMRPGQKVTIDVDAYARSFDGVVESIAGGTQGRFSLLPSDNAATNFVKVVQRIPVTIRFTALPPDVLLLPGMSVDVTVSVP